MGQPITVKKVRIAFARSLFKAKQHESGGKAKYEATLLFDKTNEEHMEFIKKLKKSAVADLNEKFGENKAKWPKALRKKKLLGDYLSEDGKNGWPFKDGDEVGFEGAEGHVVLVAKKAQESGRPAIVDRRRNPIDDPSQLESGMIVNANINTYPYDGENNKGVALGVNGVQVVGDDGTRWGSGPAVNDMFDEEDGDEDDPSNYGGGEDDEDDEWGDDDDDENED